MKTDRHRDPRNTNSQLGRAYWQHHARVMAESFATDNPGSLVAQMREEMLQAIGPDTPAGDPDAVERFSALYKDASAIVFPATSAYLAVCHALNEYSTSHSLSSIDLEILRAIDLEAHRNAAHRVPRAGTRSWSSGSPPARYKSRIATCGGVDEGSPSICPITW